MTMVFSFFFYIKKVPCPFVLACKHLDSMSIMLQDLAHHIQCGGRVGEGKDNWHYLALSHLNSVL